MPDFGENPTSPGDEASQLMSLLSNSKTDIPASEPCASQNILGKIKPYPTCQDCHGMVVPDFQVTENCEFLTFTCVRCKRSETVPIAEEPSDDESLSSIHVPTPAWVIPPQV